MWLDDARQRRRHHLKAIHLCRARRCPHRHCGITHAALTQPTALIMQRIAGLPEPPEPQTDEALAAVGRVILRIAVERVAAVNHLPPDETA